MGYVVIENFVDMIDNNHEYCIGDVYPRCGAVINKSRIAELSGYRNKLKKPLIKENSVSGGIVRQSEKDASMSLLQHKKRGRKSRKGN